MAIMAKSTKPRAVNVADAKRDFSDLLGRVSYGRESIVIMRRGKPIAKLVPLDAEEPPHPATLRGWLEDDDPFLEAIEAIVENRQRHTPRVLSRRRRAARKAKRR
jgi:prevent-host-death family protein